MPLVISVNTKYGYFKNNHIFYFVLFIRDVCCFYRYHDCNVVCLKEYYV